MWQWLLLSLAVVGVLGAVAWFLSQRRVSETVLRKVVHPRTGRVRRVM